MDSGKISLKKLKECFGKHFRESDISILVAKLPDEVNIEEFLAIAKLMMELV